MVNNVDFPTEGNPTIPILLSPDLATSNPSPAAPFLHETSMISLFNFANFAFKSPKWYDVALFFYVLAISVSISAIF